MAESIITFSVENVAASGYYTEAANPNKSISTETWTKIVDFTLTKGLWLIDACVRFGSNATGRRFIAIDPNVTGSSTYHTGQYAALQNDQNYARRTIIRNVTANSETCYIWAWQSSGGALSVNYYALRYIKLA